MIRSVSRLLGFKSRRKDSNDACKDDDILSNNSPKKQKSDTNISVHDEFTNFESRSDDQINSDKSSPSISPLNEYFIHNRMSHEILLEEKSVINLCDLDSTSPLPERLRAVRGGHTDLWGWFVSTENTEHDMTETAPNSDIIEWVHDINRCRRPTAV